jgi:hypothetical protein
MVDIITNQKSAKNLKFERFVYAGLLGTVAFNVVMYADIAITGIPLDIVAVLGNLIVGESEYAQPIGYTIHLANGVGLSLLFGYVILPISYKIKKLPIIINAVIFAVIELIIAVWFVMLPALGAGIAGLNIALEVPLMTLTRHVIFGIVVGLILRRDIK